MKIWIVWWISSEGDSPEITVFTDPNNAQGCWKEHAFTAYECDIDEISTVRWIGVEEGLPEVPGEYLVTYHPCYWDNVDKDRVEVGMDTFRGKKSWARHKYQRVIAWAEKPLPYMPEEKSYEFP